MMMKIQYKKTLNIEDDTIKIGDIIQGYEQGLIDNDYIKVEYTKPLAYEEIRNKVYVQTPLSNAIDLTFKIQMYTNKKYKSFPDYNKKLSELKDQLERLKKISAVSCTVPSSIVDLSDSNQIGLSGKDLRLMLVVAPVSGHKIDRLRYHNPFNLDFSKVEGDYSIDYYVFNRCNRCECDQVVINSMIKTPVRWVSLAPFVSSLAEALNVMALSEVVIAPYDLLGKINFVNKRIGIPDDDIILKDDLEFVPRSLEELLLLCGYDGNLPFIDAEYGTHDITVNGNTSSVPITCAEFITSVLIKRDITNLRVRSIFNGKGVGSIADNPAVVLTKIRGVLSLLTYMYTDSKPEIKDDLSFELDITKLVVRIVGLDVKINN